MQEASPERQRVSSGSPFEPAIGFSRGYRSGHHIAISGTAPVWPEGYVDPNPLVQARRCWEVAVEALTGLGGTVADVVRTRTYLTTPDVADAAGQAHGEWFRNVMPASTMIVVAGLLDPRWLVEVELDAVLGDRGVDSAGSTSSGG